VFLIIAMLIGLIVQNLPRTLPAARVKLEKRKLLSAVRPSKQSAPINFVDRASDLLALS
jgi:hypothetical protein